MIDTVIPAAMHHEADPPVTGRHDLLHCEPDDFALIVGDVVQLGLMRQVINLDRAETRPIEVKRYIYFPHVRRDDEAVDSSGRKNGTEPIMRETRLPHPKVIHAV